VPKSFRSIRCLLLVLSSASIAACNSSGNNLPEESANHGEDRPTIVSSDAVTIRDDTAAESPVQTDSNEAGAVADPVPEVDTPPDDPASNVDENPNREGEIDTIEGLLAHLEAKRNDAPADDAPTENPADTEADTTVDEVPDADAVTDADVLTDDTAVPDPVAVDPAIVDDASVETTDPLPPPVDDSSDPVVDVVTEVQTDPGDSSTGSDPTQAPGDVDVTDAAGDVEPDADVTTDAVSETGSDDGVQQVDGESPAPGPADEPTTNAGFSSDKHDIVLDCMQKLPCTASNIDGAVAVVVENVYRHPETRRLAIAMSVTANRDTALRWDNDITSTDNVATTYNGTSREFSGFYQFDRDNDMVTLLAGTTLLVVQHFREMPSDTTASMVRFDTGYIEAGVRTALQFSNMPLDPVLGDIVDCADQVPCSWVANDQSYSVNVLKTSGLWQTGRLRIDFEVRATVGMGVNLFSSEPVVGNDGSVFTPRTHSIGGTSDYQEFTVQLVPEGVMVGHQDFLKNANRLATSLVQVKLGMTRVDAPGAGSPVFRNLPLE